MRWLSITLLLMACGCAGASPRPASWFTVPDMPGNAQPAPSYSCSGEPPFMNCYPIP